MTRFADELKPSIFLVQQESGVWRNKAYPDTANIELQALGVCEEAGELAHAVLKFKQGIRGYDKEKTAEEVGDAIGDIFIYACGVADHLGINVVESVEKAWQHVKSRNITQGSDPGINPRPDYEDESDETTVDRGIGCWPPVVDDGGSI
jgi:NTP pyrophosphatase (non-canonical NTP hydrolase)